MPKNNISNDLNACTDAMISDSKMYGKALDAEEASIKAEATYKQEHPVAHLVDEMVVKPFKHVVLGVHESRPGEATFQAFQKLMQRDEQCSRIADKLR